jgi:hypothetical protein
MGVRALFHLAQDRPQMKDTVEGGSTAASSTAKVPKKIVERHRRGAKIQRP